MSRSQKLHRFLSLLLVEPRNSLGSSPRIAKREIFLSEEFLRLAALMMCCGSFDPTSTVLIFSPLAGNFTSDVYAEDCLFEDPTIKFRGKDRYSENLNLLAAFLKLPYLELEKIEKAQKYEMNYVKATWKLRTYLNFPWKPLISIEGATTYDLDKDFKIVRHAESWNISALEAVGQIFKAGPRDYDK